MESKLNSIINWLNKREKETPLNIQTINFFELDQWYFETETGNLKHNTEKFFSIIGIDVKINCGVVNQWTQPIIKQPEIGILGIITKEIV